MTLIVALGGPDGVAIAADSAMTARAAATFPLDSKLTRVPDRPLVIGVAGDVSASQYARAAVTGPPTLPDTLDGIRREIGERLQRAVPPRSGDVSLIVAGLVGGAPLILQVGDGRDVACDERLGWYSAIGNYGLVADFLAAPIRRASRTLAQNTALAYRLLDDVCDTGAGFVMRPIRVWVVAVAEPEPRQLTDAELARLDARVAAWRARDVDRALVEAAAVGSAILAPTLIDRNNGHDPEAAASLRIAREA